MLLHGTIFFSNAMPGQKPGARGSQRAWQLQLDAASACSRSSPRRARLSLTCAVNVSWLDPFCVGKWWGHDGEMIHITSGHLCLAFLHSSGKSLLARCIALARQMDSSCWKLHSGFDRTQTYEGHVGETCKVWGQKITTESYLAWMLDTLPTIHSRLHTSFPNVQINTKGINYFFPSTEVYSYFDGGILIWVGLNPFLNIFDGELVEHPGFSNHQFLMQSVYPYGPRLSLKGKSYTPKKAVLVEKIMINGQSLAFRH